MSVVRAAKNVWVSLYKVLIGQIFSLWLVPMSPKRLWCNLPRETARGWQWLSDVWSEILYPLPAFTVIPLQSSGTIYSMCGCLRGGGRNCTGHIQGNRRFRAFPSWVLRFLLKTLVLPNLA